MLSREHRGVLLQEARRAIESRLGGYPAPAPRELPAELTRASGAFVTLRRRGDNELRGCIGFVEPEHALHDTVARAAVAAATQDARFEPVTLEELKTLVLDISVLGPAAPIASADVTIGRHGLIVERGARRGLLLPQVPLEWGWDRETFLGQACRKAGLPRDAWRDRETRLLAFEAEVFGEGEASAQASARRDTSQRE